MIQSANCENTSTIGKTNRIFYTDGGCYNNGDRKGDGSWAFLEPTDINNGVVEVHCEYVENTTNNRTEMLAVLNAIKHAHSNGEKPLIHVITDSGYVHDGYSNPSYLDKWVASGWKTSNNKPVLNKDLWLEFIELSWHNSFGFELIRGHNKDSNHLHAFWNDICDRCCTYMLDNMADSPDNRYILTYEFKTKKVVGMRLVL